jgi:hypothetical protein
VKSKINVAFKENTCFHTSSVVSPCIIAKGDSAASSHYWRKQDAQCLEGVQNFEGPSVLLPNRKTIQATQKGQLPLSTKLSPQAQTAMILPQLKSASLISIGQLCDDNCDVLLNKHHLVAIKDKQVILTGVRNPYDKLWDIPVQKQAITSRNFSMPAIHPSIYQAKIEDKKHKSHHPPRCKPKKNTFIQELNQFNELIDHNILDNFLHKERKKTTAYCHTNLTPQNPSLAVIINKKRTHAELIQYLHAACFSPVKSTFEKAIKKNFFKTWPGLTPQLVSKYLHLPPATTQGHLHQERQGLQSTKSPVTSDISNHQIREHLKKLKAKKKIGETLEDVLKQELSEHNFPSSDTPNKKKKKSFTRLLIKKTYQQRTRI